MNGAPVAPMRDDKCAYSYVKNLKGRHTCRLEGNIRTYFREVLWESVDWVDRAQDTGRMRALVNTTVNSRTSLKAEEFLAS
jgi:hypothetical protein